MQSQPISQSQLELINSWPQHIQDFYWKEQRRIDEMRAALPDDGSIPIPFVCGLCCRGDRFDLQMVTGDGLPMCGECFERQVRSLDT